MSRPATQAKPAPALASAPLAAPQRFGRALVSALVLAFLTVAGGLWWMCARNEAIAFLPERAGAEWIVFPRPAETMPHDVISITVVFRDSFTLTAQPANAALAVCAFKGAAVAINGREVSNTPCADRSWKLPSGAEVAGLLRPGTNVITAWVSNAVGPPALWLRLKSGRFSLGTGEGWQVSLNGDEWRSARRARQPPELQPDSSLQALYGSTRVMDLLKRVWPVEGAFCAVSVALVWGLKRWLRHKRMPGGTLPTATSTKLIYSLLVIVVMARAALFLNNAPQIPPSIGFDVEGHKEYIQFIQQKHTLPLANDGWEMFQPPLYYLVSAVALGGCGCSVGDADAAYYLRAVNGVVGLLHCWVVFLCLRLLFWGNLPAQAAGLLVAAFLPPHLYLSQYLTNEPLAGFLVTVAIYFCLLALRAEQDGLWRPIGIGVALGAAMLAKFSVLLALPWFPVALSQRVVAGKEHAWRDWLRSVGAVVVGCLVVCGWHYGRVWAHFGKPIVGNWEAQSGQGQWWGDPGFGTSAFYSRFGQVLVSPSFSGFHSFADGFYSTLWGDGLASGGTYGMLLPPWNHDLMGAGYWISLGVTLLLIMGAALVLAKIVQQARGEWLLVFGIVCSLSFGILWMTLVMPCYAQVKAFYAFPALLPFSALVAEGWDWLRRRHRAAGSAVWVLLLVWSMTVYTSFWVRSGSPMTELVSSTELGRAFMQQGKFDEAIGQFEEAVRVKPDYALAHNNLGYALAQKGRLDEAIRQYQEALRLDPGCTLAHFNLGNALADKGQIDEAIRQIREALRLKPDYAEAYNNLGLVLNKKGQSDEAIRHYQEALRLKPSYAEAHNNLAIALADKGQIDEAIRHYQEALRLKPDHAEARNNLGVALNKKGQSDEAIRQYQEALRLKPGYAEAHNNLGIALAQKGQTDEAIRCFEQALRLKPDYASARQNLDTALAIKARSSPPPGGATNR